MTVSAIITVCNDAAYLKQALTSIFNQTLLPQEVIVVDDGSADNSAEIICREQATNKPTINCFYKENGGPASARNYGAREAKGQFIAFLDVDDAWLPDNLEKKLSLISSCTSQYFGVYGSFIPTTTNRIAKFRSFDGELPRDLIGVSSGFPGGAPSFLFRRDILLDVGGFDEDLVINEDFGLILKLIKAGWLCKGNCQPGFIRNMRPESLTRGADVKLNHDRIVRFLDSAVENDFLSEKEILRRRKTNNLVLARRLWKLGASKTEVGSALRAAFHNSWPNNIRETGAYLLHLWLLLQCSGNVFRR